MISEEKTAFIQDMSHELGELYDQGCRLNDLQEGASMLERSTFDILEARGPRAADIESMADSIIQRNARRYGIGRSKYVHWALAHPLWQDEPIGYVFQERDKTYCQIEIESLSSKSLVGQSPASIDVLLIERELPDEIGFSNNSMHELDNRAQYTLTLNGENITPPNMTTEALKTVSGVLSVLDVAHFNIDEQAA